MFDHILQVSLKQIILVGAGLAILVLVLLLAPLLLVGLAVGFLSGLFFMNRYPQRFNFFVPKTKEQRIKEHQDAIRKLEASR